MAYNNETKVSKNSTFEEWRQGTNQISHDVGSIESNSNKSADSLDKENRLTDQTKTVSVSNTAATPVGVALDATAPWVGFQELHDIVNTNQKGSILHETTFISNGGLGNQKFSVAANGNITLAPNVQLYDRTPIGPITDSNGNTYNTRNVGATDGGIHLSAYSYQEDASWVGKTITFSGSVNANFDLDSRYSVKAFIKVLDVNNNYSLISITEVNLRTLTNNAFSFSKFVNSPQGSNYLPQIGFEVAGVNAKDGTAVANTSVVLSNLSVSVSAGQGEVITTSEEFIRDQSNGANNSGMRIDLAPDKKIDMTAGYLILTGSSGAPTDFVAGNDIIQHIGNSASNAQTFRASIVSVIKPSTNITKILISNVTGTFDPALILGSGTQFAVSSQQIPAANLVRQVTGILDYGYVRVYKTNSGTTTKLEQGIGITNGFHLPRVSMALSMSSGNALPAAFLLEGERIYQTANGQVENAESNPPSFEAKILTSTVSDKYSLGIYGGFLLYDVIGTFLPARQLRCTSTNSSTVAASRFDQSAAHSDYNIDNTFSSIIRLNTPAVAGDSFEMEFSSAVDAIVELQDDIGRVEDLATNGALAGFGPSAVRKTLTTTDLVTTLNTLQDMVGNAVIPTIANNTHLVPNNVSTISDATKNIVTFIGDTDLSNANLGATANTSSTLTDAITTIKTFVGSTDISDIASGENITTAIAQLHDEVGDVTLLNASATTTAGGFSTQVVTSSLIQLRSLVSPSTVSGGFLALDNGGTNYANGLGNNNLVSSIVELRVLLGDKTGLNQSTLGDVADTPSTIVAAINNIKAYIGTTVGIANIKAGTSDDTITGAIKQLHDEIGDQTLTAGTNYNTSVGTLSAAIHGIQAMLGDVSVNNIGAANNVTAAITKMHAELGDADSLNVNPTALNVGTTDGTGGFRNTTGGSDATIVSALTQLRQALVGDNEHLAVVGSRTAATRDANLEFAKNDLNNAVGFSKTNVIDSILEIQDLMGNVTSLDDNDSLGRFNTANIVASLVELRTAIVGDNDLTDTIATLDDDSGSTDYTSTNLVTAITEIQAELGQVSLLTATPFHADLHGSYSNTDFQLAINGITAAIGNADIGIAINSGNETLTNAIRQLRIDIGDVGDNGVNLAAATGYSATNLNSAIFEIQGDIGDVTNINNATGYAATSAVTGITEIQGLIGNPVATAANLGAINTRVQKDTDSAVAATETTIPMADTTGIVVGMTVLNTETGRTGSIAAGTKVTTVNAGVSVVVDTGVVSTINSGDNLRFDVSTVVNAINAIDARIGQEINSTNMGTTAATLVPAIKEITDELGAVTAGNLGTTSSTITTAIKEVVDGTGAATVTVAGIASQQPTGKLDSVSATKQTIIGDIDFNSPNNAATTTLKFGQGTVLDVSAGTLKMSDATAPFNISSTFLNLQGTANTGQGLQIDRSTITGASVTTGNDAFFQWKEASISTNNPASAHNQNDIAWQIRGLTSVTSPVHYTQANVDFQNAYRLFGIGTTNNANSMTNVTVAWDSTNHNFDISLNDSATDMTSGSDAGNAVYGTSAKVPQVTVDRQGRISAITEVALDNVITTFDLLGDTGAAQPVGATNDIKIAGTANEIATAVTDASGVKTITIGLPDNVDVDGTFGAAGNVTLASGNGASSTITLGGTNTATTIAGTLNIPGTLNVTGFNNSVTVSNTTITGDALILRTEDNSIPANSDTPKFVVNRGFSTTKNINALVIGKRYKITLTDTTTNGGFTALGAQDNDVGTVFTATGSADSDTGGRAKEQRNEAAIVWQEEHDQFMLRRGTVQLGVVSTNTQQGAIIAQGDTIGSATKFTAASNANNEDKQVLFADVTGSTSQLQRNSGLLFNPSTNKLTLSGGQLDLSGYFKHLDGVTSIHTDTNAKPLHISRYVGASQVMKVGVSDREVVFNYIEDTSTEGKNVFGSYKFLLNGNHGDADEVADRIALIIDKDKIATRGLTVNTNGIVVTGGSTTLLSTSVAGTLTHTGLFNQQLGDTSSSANTLGRTAGDSKLGASFNGRVGFSNAVAKLQIEDVRMTTQNSTEETYVTAAKRIQHGVDTSDYSFLDFQGSNSNVHEARIGGIANSLTKTYFKGKSDGAAELYHNVASGTASAKKLETTATGITVTGNAKADSLIFTGVNNDSFSSGGNGIRKSSTGMQYDSLTSHIFNVDENNNNSGSTFEVRKNGSATQRLLRVNEQGDFKLWKFADGATDTTGATGLDWISSTGSLGIGTTTPSGKLDVRGTINAYNFFIARDVSSPSSIIIEDTNTTTNYRNRIKLSNSTNTEKAGVMSAQSAQLGATAGDVSVQAVFKSFNNNNSYLQILDQRDSNGSAWGTAHKRLEFGTDNQRMSYIAQNLNENYGLEIGSSAHGGISADFASQPWISMKRAASGNGPGAVELYHGNAGTSSLKFQTLSDGVNITGNMEADSADVNGNLVIRNAAFPTAQTPNGHGSNYTLAGDESPLHILKRSANLQTDNVLATFEVHGADYQTTPGKISIDFKGQDTNNKTNFARISQATVNGTAYGDSNEATSNLIFGATSNGVYGEKMIMTGGGRLGVGTLNPTVTLDVAGDIKLSGIIDQNGTGTNDFEGQIDCNKDVKTTASGKGFYAFGGGSDYLTMTHDGSGGHITSSDKLEIETPIFEVRKGAGSELMIKAVQDDAVTLYNNNIQRLVTTSTGVRIGTDADDVATASYVDGTRFNPSTLEVNRIKFDSGLNSNDNASITFVSTEAGVNNRSALDIKIADDVSDTVANADKIRMRMQSGAVNSNVEYSLVEISGKSNGSTRMDLTQSPGSTSEVISDIFTGALTGNASTATTLSATLTVSKGGTGATSFADKSVIISQDSGTDTLAAVTMSTNGQLLIGGTSGPTATTLTAGNGIDVTNGNGTITVAAELASSSNTGVAKFDATQFSVASGNVTIKALGVANSKIANDAVTFGKMQNIATNTIMGRTLSGTGNAKALTATEARGVLNVADGADNYNSFNIRSMTNAGVGELVVQGIGSNATITFRGAGATTVTRAGSQILVSSTNSTYTAGKGMNLSGGSVFAVKSDIREYTHQRIGSKSGYWASFNKSSLGRVDGSDTAGDIFSLYNSLNSEPSATFEPAADVDSAVTSNERHKSVLSGLWSAKVAKTTPTSNYELTSKYYVDREVFAVKQKLSAATFGRNSRLGTGTTTSPTQLSNCAATRAGTGRYTITIDQDVRHGTSGHGHIVASLNANALQYAASDEGGTIDNTTNANDFTYNYADPQGYIITAYPSTAEGFTGTFHVRTYKLSTSGGYIPGGYHVQHPSMELVDIPFSVIIYNGDYNN